MGAKVGEGTGVALGAAAAPVMCGPFAALMAVGTVLEGAEIDGIVGAMRTGEPIEHYKSPSTRPAAWHTQPSLFVLPSRNAALVIPSRRRGISTSRSAEIPRVRPG
jgi:hypothetical protein